MRKMVLKLSVQGLSVQGLSVQGLSARVMRAAGAGDARGRF